MAGIVISPFLLGGLFSDPIILNFAFIEGEFVQGGLTLHEFSPVEIISEIDVVVLLFVAGVKTDVRAFLRYGMTGGVVAIGGVILPFAFGYFITMMLFPGGGMVAWLFMGATLTATSIGLTVRILMDMGRLQTREGIIILVAAVVDDIIGIVILSVVISMGEGGAMNIAQAAITAAIGFAVWFALLMVGARFHRQISAILLKPFKRSGTMPIFAVLVGFLVVYLVTLVDLHPVVGA